MKHNRYSFLDGIRGLAALFVVVRHTSYMWDFRPFRSYLAVDIFFILSGFVIAYAYDEKLKNKIISFPKFVAIRLIRLYPVFLLSVLISGLFFIYQSTYLHQSTDLLKVLSVIGMTLLFLPSHMTGVASLFPINGPYWSLFFELISNFIYAALRPFLNNVNLFLIVAISGTVLISMAFKFHHLDIGFNWSFDSIAAGFTRSVFGIFLGLLIQRNYKVLLPILEKLKLSPWLSFIVVAITLASPDMGRFNAILDILSVIIIFPVCIIIASQATMTRFEGLLLKLGAASYPIYLIHVPLSKFLSYISKRYLENYAPLTGLIFVTVLVFLSVAIEKLYDIPLRKKITDYVFKKNSNVLIQVPLK